jgi:hypothetical protein
VFDVDLFPSIRRSKLLLALSKALQTSIYTSALGREGLEGLSSEFRVFPVYWEGIIMPPLLKGGTFCFGVQAFLFGNAQLLLHLGPYCLLHRRALPYPIKEPAFAPSSLLYWRNHLENEQAL